MIQAHGLQIFKHSYPKHNSKNTKYKAHKHAYMQKYLTYSKHIYSSWRYQTNCSSQQAYSAIVASTTESN